MGYQVDSDPTSDSAAAHIRDDFDDEQDRDIERTLVRINELIASDLNMMTRQIKIWFPENASDVDDWRGLLASAPSAIVSLAFCFLATLSEGARELGQENGHQVPALRASINECCEIGLRAFNVAQDQMVKVAASMLEIKEPWGTMESIRISLDDVIQFMDEKDTKRLDSEIADLTMQVDKLQRDIEKCSNASEKVHGGFEEWHQNATNIHKTYTKMHAERSAEAAAKAKKENKSLFKAIQRVSTMMSVKSGPKTSALLSQQSHAESEYAKAELTAILKSGSSPVRLSATPYNSHPCEHMLT